MFVTISKKKDDSPIVCTEGQLHDLAFRDGNLVDRFTGHGCNWLGQRENIVLCSVAEQMIHDRVEAKCFL